MEPTPLPPLSHHTTSTPPPLITVQALEERAAALAAGEQQLSDRASLLQVQEVDAAAARDAQVRTAARLSRKALILEGREAALAAKEVEMDEVSLW